MTSEGEGVGWTDLSVRSDEEALAPGLLACLRGAAPPGADWLALMLAANQHLVTPAVHCALREDDPSVPSDAQAYLRAIYEDNAARNHRLRSQLAEAARALNGIGVEPMAIKGAAILSVSAPDVLGRRMMADLDIVVPKPTIAAAVSALEAIGYEVRSMDQGPHAFADLVRPGQSASIDLHHRPPGPVELFAHAGEDHNAQGVEVDGARLLVASPTMRLAHLVAHDMLHDRRLRRGGFDLRHLLDARDIVETGGVNAAELAAHFPNGSGRLALCVYLQSLERWLGVVLEGAPAPSALARLLFARQALRARSARVRSLDRRLAPLGHQVWLQLTQGRGRREAPS